MNNYTVLYCAFTDFLLTILKTQLKLLQAKIDHLHNRISFQDQELQRADYLKTEFINNLNHEIHAPLTGIITMGEAYFTYRSKMETKELEKTERYILASYQRLKQYTDNILNLSKLTSMRYQLNLEPVNFSKLVEKAVEECRKLYCDDKQLEFRLRITPGLILNCDARYIRHTIDNLIINAINYTHEGVVSITLTRANEGSGIIEFSVSDEGIGIPADELEEIFGAFVVSSRTWTPAGGRGVGLALCKKVIELHGGQIQARNNQNKGVTFSFIL